MSPFTPLAGRARWRILYEDILVFKTVNEVATYSEMGKALKLHPDKDRTTIQMAMRRAARALEEINKHAVEPVPNEGYRIVEPAEQMGLARRQQKKSGNALKSGRSKVVNVDLTGMDPEIRKAFEVMATAFSMQMDMNRRLSVRQDRLEKAVASIADAGIEHRKRSDEEIAELKARLDRLEGATTT